MNHEHIISVNEVCKNFTIQSGSWFRRESRTVSAVDSVSFDIKPGEQVAYIGPNGAGKSTTIKMMTGVLTPSSGKISVCGFDPGRERRKLALHIGVVFGQRSQLWWDLPLMDSFKLLRHVYRVEETVYREQLDECMELLALQDFVDTPVRQLSLGQRMRGELAAALLHRPEVLFLDEPTIGLDVVSKEAVREFIVDMAARYGTTLLLTTHDMSDIERLCQRLIIIDHGKVHFDGAFAELQMHHGSDDSLEDIIRTIFSAPVE